MKSSEDTGIRKKVFHLSEQNFLSGTYTSSCFFSKKMKNSLGAEGKEFVIERNGVEGGLGHFFLSSSSLCIL